MTTLTITLENICAGGNHLTFGVSGDATGNVRTLLDDMLGPLTDDEKTAFVKIIAKMARAGRTAAQARTLLQAGVTVIV